MICEFEFACTFSLYSTIIMKWQWKLQIRRYRLLISHITNPGKLSCTNKFFEYKAFPVKLHARNTGTHSSKNNMFV